MTKILIIEDDPVTLTLMKEFLGAQGCETISARNGIEGLKIFDDGGIGLVITDIIMPEMEGIEIIRRIRQIDSEVPIIAISGGSVSHRVYNMPDYLSIALEFGATTTLRKPLFLTALGEEINRLASVHS